LRVVNNIVLRKLPGEPKEYLSSTTLILSDQREGDDVPGGFRTAQEELDNINPARIPPHRLTLKVGAPVMLLLNLNKKQGLCNGTRFVVTRLLKHSVCVRRLIPFKGKLDEIFLPRLLMRTDDVPVAGTIQRLQIPLVLAFCITINKSQGQTFDKVGLFLRRSVFSHGQYFVALSRAKTRKNVAVAVVNGIGQGSRNRFRGGRGSRRNVITKNIVIRQLLEL
jgi:ATP-dependent DNA helicase PIF1